MTHDEICTYEVCKLAKEKGFNEPTFDFYDDDGSEGSYSRLFAHNEFPDGPYAAPTQSLLQRWLREEKGIIIVLGYSYNTEDWRPFWSWIVYDKLGFTIEVGDNHDTYELALEDALKYALKNLV